MADVPIGPLSPPRAEHRLERRVSYQGTYMAAEGTPGVFGHLLRPNHFHPQG